MGYRPSRVIHIMRNIFDQYDQPENKLTHALYCTLRNDRTQIRPFLSWLGIRSVPPLKELRICQQQVPGQEILTAKEERKGLRDLCIYTNNGWVAIFEMKVQSRLALDQLRRHVKTLERRDFASPHLVVITVDPPPRRLPPNTRSFQWRDVFGWFDKRTSTSSWARLLVEYMQIYEAKMLARDYDVRGTITMFNGLRFDAM